MSGPENIGTARILIEQNNLVGESPLWDDRRGGLWWVDIRAPALHFLAYGAAASKTWKMPARAGFVVLCDDGSPLVGLASGLHLFNPANGSLSKVLDPLEGHGGMRLNEGQIDPDGRLWFGTMQDQGKTPIGALLRWQPGHKVETLRKDIHIPNGLSFGMTSSDASFADSAQGALNRIGPNGAHIKEIVAVDAAAGIPDGAVRDVEAHIWLALFGGGCVIRIAPDGSIERRISVPAPNVTAVTLGGPDGCDLFITTARLRLTENELQTWQLSGGLFRASAPAPGRPPGRLRLGSHG